MDVLVAVRILASLTIITSVGGIPISWSNQETYKATVETAWALVYILFSVLVFVGVAKQRAQLLVPYTIMQMVDAAIFAIFALVFFVVVPLLPPKKDMLVSRLEQGVVGGVACIICGLLFLFFFALSISAYRLLSKNTKSFGGYNRDFGYDNDCLA